MLITTWNIAKRDSLEKLDDYLFKIYLGPWGLANTGDGSIGPTLFEKHVVIPWVLRIFSVKEGVVTMVYFLNAGNG